MEKPANRVPEEKKQKVEISIPMHIHRELSDMSETLGISYSDCAGMLFSEGLDLWYQSSWEQRRMYREKYMNDKSIGQIKPLEK